MTARSMSLSGVASPRATDPKRMTASTSSFASSRTTSVRAAIGSRRDRKGGTAMWSSWMVWTPARPMVCVSTRPSRETAFNASWTDHRL